MILVENQGFTMNGLVLRRSSTLLRSRSTILAKLLMSFGDLILISRCSTFIEHVVGTATIPTFSGETRTDLFSSWTLTVEVEVVGLGSC